MKYRTKSPLIHISFSDLNKNVIIYKSLHYLFWRLKKEFKQSEKKDRKCVGEKKMSKSSSARENRVFEENVPFHQACNARP